MWLHTPEATRTAKYLGISGPSSYDSKSALPCCQVLSLVSIANLSSKEDTLMQCLLHVGPSLTLDLFRKGLKMIIFQIMLKWALVHLSDDCSEVYWFGAILSFAHCLWWGCFTGIFSSSSCPPSVSLIPLCPHPTKPYTMPQPHGHWWTMTSVGGCQTQGSFLAGLCNVLLLFFLASAPGTWDRSVNVYWMSKSLPSWIHALPLLITHSRPLFLVYA